MAGLGLSSSEVALRIKLNNIVNKDLVSKSDPFVVVYLQSSLREHEGVSLL